MIAADPAPTAELPGNPLRAGGAAVPDVDAVAILLGAGRIDAVHHPTAIAPGVAVSVDHVARRLAEHDRVAHSIHHVGNAGVAVLAEHVAILLGQRLPEVADDG